ncbi:MAG: ATP-grasp domain-containing protein [Xenococcaceae cyanobacterium MO_188.B29]|nr:ATP-grasp domain-containing protein [Xenococcaceae cyanobacterium MO_188.B29]
MSGKKIFNHDVMHCTSEAVIGNYLYSARVLGMSEPDDLIQLHPDLVSQWTAITNHYGNIGLTHSHNPIWNVSFQELKKYPDYEPSVYIFADALHENSEDDDWFRDRNQNWQDVVAFINSKNNFIRLAQELNINVPLTFCAANQTQLKQNYPDISYPCYLKPAISVDGAGIFRCTNQDELDNALTRLEDNIPLQLQQEVTASKFLNLQYEVTGEDFQPLAATEQVLDGFSHQGNRYPTAYEPWELVQPMAQWMTQKGMKGIFAFDVAVMETETDIDYFAIECNPRFNGASYPTGIAQKLKIESWSSNNFTTKYRSLEDIDLSGLEYDHSKSTGVIIYNWGTIFLGRLGFLLAGSIAQQEELRKLLKQRLE